MDAQTNVYLQYYRNQNGGGLDTFLGARRGQYGNGIGDVLKGILRTVLPIAARGASTFLSETFRNKDSGMDWKNAAKEAIGPTSQTTLDHAVSRITKRKASPRTTTTKRRRHRKRKSNQKGGRRSRKVFKRKRRTKSKKRFSKRIKFLNF